MRAMGAVALTILAALGCNGGGGAAPDATPDAALDAASAPPRVMMDFTRAGGFFDAPFPSDDLRAGGRIDLAGFPGPAERDALDQLRTVLADATGFATTGGVFFRVTAPLDPLTLPGVIASVADDAPIFLISLDAGATDHGRRYPVEIAYQADGGDYGAADLLSVLPLQGVPLRPATRYAAVITTAVTTVDGVQLAPAAAAALATYPGATAALAALGVDDAAIAGLAVFTTGDPRAELGVLRAAALAMPLPVPDAPPRLDQILPDFCVYKTTIAMPTWQSGEPPFRRTGGTWTYDAEGAPILQRHEPANLVLTVPRTPMPATGYPLAIYVRSGGDDEAMVHHGRDGDGDEQADEPGDGPARYFARGGFAGLQVDGPLGGRRNVTDDNEHVTFFNVLNPGALRDNVREAAVELALMAHIVPTLRVDASTCPALADGGPGPADARFDADHLALMGHSTGATIAPLAAAIEPRFGALILSGAGGSWIENILHKREPIPIRLFVESHIHDSDLVAGDPILSLIQWALEPADPPTYADAVVHHPQPGAGPRHVLVIQGIVDLAILPRIANATNLSLGVDLAGAPADIIVHDDLVGQAPLGPLLPLIGRRPIALPAAGNITTVAGAITAVVVQHPGDDDGQTNGHEVIFQLAAARLQYQCFLASWLTGTPTVVAPTATGCPTTATSTRD